MKRLDAVLVERTLAPTRSKAQQLIEAGEVEVEIAGAWNKITQSSYKIDSQQIRIVPEARTLKYVSRGGLKLEGALKHLGLNVDGYKCFDVGLSTGGFADCLLQHGAARVVGVDVGHGQVAEKLKTEAKLKQFEGVHVRDVPAHSAVRALLSEGVDLTTVDVSFISLSHVLPVLADILPQGAKLLALVKPQFEVGPSNLDKNGIVHDPKLFDSVRAQVLSALEKNCFSGGEYFACDVKGQDGNQEFFVFATRS
jgi:23S rRNA (cytidine1920-2'-O)/16S rRNA (cytidine1409-2'-O)-methyltransferase